MRSILFVMLSMQSFYLYQISMPAISVLSLFFINFILISFFKEEIFKIQVSPTSYILGVYLFLFLWGLLGLLYMEEYPDIKRTLGFILIFNAVLIAEKFFINISKLKLIRHFLIIHLSFFYIQFLAHYVLNVQIDYIFFITGEEQRTLSDNFISGLTGDFIRPSGLFIEPGTYAAFIAPFIALLSKWYKNSKSNQLFK